MNRDLGVLDGIQGVLPDAAAVVLALVTFLGASWFVGALLAIAVSRVDRSEAVTAGGITIAAIGALLSLKHLFAAPRPDRRLVDVETLPDALAPIYEIAIITEGHGFPSGHATTATVGYLLLAELVPVGTRRQRYVAAVSVVALVSFSRVALGAHYAVDVVAGALLGLGVVLVSRHGLTRFSVRRPTAALAFGSGLALSSVLVSRGALDAVLLAAVTLPVGAWWVLVGSVPDRPVLGFDSTEHPRLTRALLLVTSCVPAVVALEHVGLI